MLLIIFGVCLFAIGLFAITQLAFIETLLCYVLGVFCIILGIRHINSKKKPSANQIINESVKPKEPKIIQQQPNVNEVPAPITRQILKHYTFKVVGVTFDCEFSDAYLDRQDVLQASKYKDVLYLKEYEFNDEIAFVVMNRRLNADIGSVPKDMVERIKALYDKYDVIGEFTVLDCFDPDERASDYDFDLDDEDENCTNTSNLIYYCRVKMNGYAKEEK